MKTLKDKSISGIKWVTVSKVIRQVLQAITVIVIASIISPSDFGIMGMALVVIGFLQVLRDLSFTAAIIQKRDVSDSLLSSVFWFSFIMGIILFFLLFFTSSVIANFYGEVKLIPVLKILSLGFVFASLSFVHQAIIERNLLFEKVAKFEIISSVCGSIIGITLAIINVGVWALVFQSLSTILFTTIVLWVINDWRPSFEFSSSEIKKIFKFSANLSGFNILNYFVRNGDYLLIGKFLGAEQLGYYTLAYQIILYPLQYLSQTISRVMFPIYSKIQNNNSEFKQYYLKVAKYIAFVAFPIMIGIFILSSEFINTAFGDNWKPVANLLLIFAPLGLLQSVYTNAGSIFKAKGRTDIWLKWGIFTSILFISGFYFGLSWGIMGVAWAYLLVNLITLYPGLKIPFSLIELKIWGYVKSLKIVFTINLAFFVILFLLKHVFKYYNISDIYTLTIISLLGILMYILLNLIFNKDMVAELKLSILHK